MDSAAAQVSPVDARPLDDDWRGWLQLNRDRGCDRRVLFEKAAAQGFDRQAVALELGGWRAVGVEPPDPEAPEPEPPRSAEPWQQLAGAPLTRPGTTPRAWRLDTPLAQIYEIPGLLSREECAAVMAAIDQSLRPSTVTRGPSDYRTSRTCHLASAAPALARELDRRFAALIGVDPAFSEPLQGQRYDPGQYFKAHTDWFAPGTNEYAEHTNPGGQRTWTLMVYLNAVELGGETCFNRIGRCFTPVPGTAVAWNNLLPDGRPNHHTLHEALPVEAGRKYVITKWFRAETGRIPRDQL